MHVISLCGAKGGSLKTATSLCLASLLVEHGMDVALLDLDPQHSATLALPRVPTGGPRGMGLPNVGVHEPLSAPPVEVDLPEWAAGHGRLNLFRGGRGLISASRGEVHRRLDGINADVLIIDTFPAITDSVVAAMERSDLIVIPTEATADALRVLPGVLDAARAVCPGGCAIRLMLSRVDIRERITTDVRAILDRDYPGLLYRTAIPADVRAKEATWDLRPVVLYDPVCRAARAYRGLLREVLGDLTAGMESREEGVDVEA